MAEHKIGWLNQEGFTGETLNPIRVGYQGRRGWHCEKAGPECANCYSETQNLAGFRGGTKLPYNRESRDKVCVYLDTKTAEKPLRWKKPRAIFWCDMTDLFGEWVPDEWIQPVLDIVKETPRHRHIFLTKRPERMARFDLTHAWVGTTAGNQAMDDERIPHLLEVKAAVRFASLEPLLGPVGLNLATPCDRNCNEYTYAECPGTSGLCIMQPKLDWLIVGTETGPRRRPCKLEWVESLVGQADAAGVPVYVKAVDLGDRVSKDPAEWPEDLRVQEFPA